MCVTKDKTVKHWVRLVPTVTGWNKELLLYLDPFLFSLVCCQDTEADACISGDYNVILNPAVFAICLLSYIHNSLAADDVATCVNQNQSWRNMRIWVCLCHVTVDLSHDISSSD